MLSYCCKHVNCFIKDTHPGRGWLGTREPLHRMPFHLSIPNSCTLNTLSQEKSNYCQPSLSADFCHFDICLLEHFICNHKIILRAPAKSHSRNVSWCPHPAILSPCSNCKQSAKRLSQASEQVREAEAAGLDLSPSPRLPPSKGSVQANGAAS